MLLKVAVHISECLENAEQARQRANSITDPKLKADYEDIELRWLRLAESYRFVEQMERFLDDAQQKRATEGDRRS